MLKIIGMRSKLVAGLLGVGMALALQLSHAVPLLNAGFETGNLTGWNIGGGPNDAGWGVVPGLTIPPAVPTQGGYMAIVSNAGQTLSQFPMINHGLPPGVVNGEGGTIGTLPVPIFIPVPVPPIMDLVRFCVLPGTFFGCAPRGVAELWQTFSVDGASTLSFDWNFLTNEEGPTFIDFAFVNIFGPSGQLLQLLARSPGGGLGGMPIGLTGMSIDPSAWAAGQYGFQTGWHHSDFALSEPGDYTFVLGVVDGRDSAISSALLIDNIQVVPEPAILALLGLGLAGLGFSRRRNKKS